MGNEDNDGVTLEPLESYVVAGAWVTMGISLVAMVIVLAIAIF